MLVPVQYQRLMARPEFDSFDLRLSHEVLHQRAVPCRPQGRCAEALAGRADRVLRHDRRWRHLHPAAHLHPTKLHTVGQPADGHDMRLIDDAGREVAPGEAGEVVGRSPAMMTGYHRQPAKTAEAEWYDPEGNRFIRTGDIGRFDADGFMVLFDRRKDMIISGGFNIYPSDLEAVLRGHPAVADVRCGGRAQRRMGRDAGGLSWCGATAPMTAKTTSATGSTSRWARPSA
jgi:long-chain acyl-CoA synthetase